MNNNNVDDFYAVLDDWFSYESISLNVNDYAAHGQMLHSIMGWSSTPSPKKICFQQCVLKKSLMQFGVGTRFDEISFNECNVVQLYIRDQDRPHALRRSGYNYRGNWRMMFAYEMDGLKRIETADETRFVWYRGSVGVNENGFSYTDCKASKDLGFVQDEEKFASASLDLVNGAFSVVTEKNGGYGGRLLVRICLQADAIATCFLDTAHKQGMIDEYELRDNKSRREDYKFDVQLPSAIRDQLPKKEEAGGRSKRKMKKSDDSKEKEKRATRKRTRGIAKKK